MKFHLTSIGGAVMHNLAIALHLKGHQVTGTDDEIYEPAKSRLNKYGLLPQETGWKPELITAETDAVILGMHARKNNPEIARAQELGIRIYSFPEFMYEQTRNKLRIVVGGSHGKTTTTAMILHVLRQQGIRFDYLVGSQLEGFETMVGFDPEAKLAVFEGDEYLTSALDLRPKFHVYQAEVGIITGIAWDHINVFPTFENYLEQFKIFIEQIPANGSLIYCAADAQVKELVTKTNPVCEQIPYTTPAFEVVDGKFIVQVNDAATGRSKAVRLEFFGTHNLQNMMAARHACNKADISDDAFFEAIASFKGTAKRLETIKETPESLIIRDFAHAPSKLRATVNAVRELYPNRKLIAVYELHTYSSLNKAFLPHYHNTLEKADVRAVLFSRHALEMKKMPMLEPSEVAAGFGNEVQVFTSKDELRAFIASHYKGRENLLLMSSGTFDGMDLAF